MASIYQIGKDLGVSPMTVSNALNNRKGVGKETARRIREYADKIGYRPSHMARVLSNGRTATIGLCLRNSPCNPWIAGILEGLNQRVRESGYTLNVILTNGDLEQIRAALQQLDEHRVEAAILGPLGYMQEYVELTDDLARLPNVLVFDAVDSLPVDHCMVDVYQGGAMAMRHLIELGHSRIGYIGAIDMEVQIEGVRNRYAAYRDSLVQHNLSFEPQWLVTQKKCSLELVDDSSSRLVDMFVKLRKKKAMPTAWFCHNDWIAAQVLRALSEIGLSVPGDVSVIGFDNHTVCQVTRPAITTVGFDLEKYVSGMVRLVFDKLKKGKGGKGKEPRPSIERLVVEPRLYERNSTGSAPE